MLVVCYEVVSLINFDTNIFEVSTGLSSPNVTEGGKVVQLWCSDLLNPKSSAADSQIYRTLRP